MGSTDHKESESLKNTCSKAANNIQSSQVHAQKKLGRQGNLTDNLVTDGSEDNHVINLQDLGESKITNTEKLDKVTY